MEKWVDQKKVEWGKIRERYYKQYKIEDSEIPYDVKRFLEEEYFESDRKKAIKPCGNLEQFESSCGLNGDASSKKSKNSNDNDLVLCMIKKLKDKIDKCKAQHTGEKQANCENSPSTTPNDEEEPLEEKEENTVAYPKICGDVIPKEEVKEESGCDPAPKAPEPADEPTIQPVPEEEAPAPI
ncbi:hypothetical protein K1I93_09650, partial [Streptococcus australis]|uniref:hypothetical protein n=1 Tax=Streptococcus australis TaxID=113107 RepID=UPI001DA13E32|nr:hypothetical protein [Streptococcus australis]